MKSAPDIFHANGFGKVAPWVDLVNSEEWDGFGKLTDQLANPRWLATFLKHWDLYPRDGSGAERLGLGASTDCGFIWRNAGKPRSGTHQNLRQFGLPVGFPRSNQGQDQALVQRPHLRQPRARPPCPGRTKAKSLTKKFLLSSGPRPNLLIGSQELFRRTSAKNSSRVCLL